MEQDCTCLMLAHARTILRVYVSHENSILPILPTKHTEQVQIYYLTRGS